MFTTDIAVNNKGINIKVVNIGTKKELTKLGITKLEDFFVEGFVDNVFTIFDVLDMLKEGLVRKTMGKMRAIEEHGILISLGNTSLVAKTGQDLPELLATTTPNFVFGELKKLYKKHMTNQVDLALDKHMNIKEEG